MLANRLSEDEKIRVLLLEAGGDGLSDSMRDPRKVMEARGDPASNWMYETTEQNQACLTNDRSVSDREDANTDSTREFGGVVLSEKERSIHVL